MNLSMIIFTTVLFYVLTPGIFLSIPPNGSKFIKAFAHAVLFALIYELTHRNVWLYLNGMA